MSVMMVQIKQRCYSSNYIQSKEIGNKKYYEETRELEKWQSEISPEYQKRKKEKGDSWHNTIKMGVTKVWIADRRTRGKCGTCGTYIFL